MNKMREKCNFYALFFMRDFSVLRQGTLFSCYFCCNGATWSLAKLIIKDTIIDKLSLLRSSKIESLH